MSKIFTFWEGKMPAYIKYCLDTWKFDYVLLTYDTLKAYTDLDVENIKRYTLPQIADVIRVHVLRDNGGYWLDADTIMFSDVLPKENMLGYPSRRDATIGFLHADDNTGHMFREWAVHQDIMIDYHPEDTAWDVMGNRFTDKYIKEHNEITIGDITPYWPETYLVDDKLSRYDSYRKLYFTDNYNLSEILNASMITTMFMLHNSWTPNWYKNLLPNKVLGVDCTMSNILKEALR